MAARIDGTNGPPEIGYGAPMAMPYAIPHQNTAARCI